MREFSLQRTGDLAPWRAPGINDNIHRSIREDTVRVLGSMTGLRERRLVRLTYLLGIVVGSTSSLPSRDHHPPRLSALEATPCGFRPSLRRNMLLLRYGVPGRVRPQHPAELNERRPLL